MQKEEYIRIGKENFGGLKLKVVFIVAFLFFTLLLNFLLHFYNRSANVLQSQLLSFQIVLFVADIILLIALLWVFVRNYFRPIEHLLSSLDLVASLNFTRKIKITPFRQNDEIGELSEKVAKVLDKVHYRTTQVEQHKKDIEESLEDLRTLSEMGKQIISSLSVEVIVKTVYDNINELFDVSLFAIGVFDEKTGGLDFWGRSANASFVKIGHDDLNDSRRWSTYCFTQKEEIFVEKYDPASGRYFSKLLFSENDSDRNSFIYLPLTNRKRCLGVITVQSFRCNAYTRYHLELLRNLANYISIALDNAAAFEQIIRQKEEISDKSEALRLAHENLEELVRIRTLQVTRQKEEIEQKNKQLEMLSIVAEQTDNAIMIMDGIGNVLWINKSFTRLYEYTYDEFITARGKNIRQTSFNPDIDKMLDTCIYDKQVVIYEAPNVTLNGDTVWTQTSLTPILNENGEVTYLATIDTDITQRKEYELEIQKKNKQLEMLSIVAEQTDNAIMIMDGIGNVLWINKSFTRLYEYTYDEFIAVRGKNIRQTSFNPDIDKMLDTCIYDKQVVIYEAPNVTLNGDTVWTQTSLTPILDENGEVTYLTTIDTDITERKEFELKILKQSQAITQSIQYAFRIQQAMFPSEYKLSDAFDEYFVLYRPKAIVSGDFYWLRKIDNVYLVAVADCTGHGVPGAFMSLLGITYLNEIVNTCMNVDAASILNGLRSRVIHALNHSDSQYETKDGMDISLCIIDPTADILQFAGAYQSIIFCNADGAIEYKGDKMPIGTHLNDKVSFTTQTIHYKKGDQVYMYSDGYKDQFGGKKGNKFMAQNFRKLLAQASEFPMSEQKAKLDEVLDSWKEDRFEQNDDILVAGFKLK